MVDGEASGPAPVHTSRLFASGGYAVMRDGWDGSANHAVIDCGPHGALNSGHAHSDALSIEITALGHPVIVDPGTFTYTGSIADRDHFRHSASHNTVTVDGEGASVAAGPFSWRFRADARIEQWWSGDLTDHFVGSHPGFARLPNPALHRRRVTFARQGYWVIIDTVEASGEHEAIAHLHLAAGARISRIDPARARIDVGGSGDPLSVLLYAGGDVDAIEWEEDWLSPAYGSRMDAYHGRLVCRGVGRLDMVTVVLPVSGERLHAIDEAPCDGGFGVRVRRGDTHDTLLFRKNAGAVRGGGIEMDADAALVRRSVAGTLLGVALWGQRARLAVDSWTFNAVAAAEFRPADAGWGVRGDGRVTSEGG
jgi:hypothetical protein